MSMVRQGGYWPTSSFGSFSSSERVLSFGSGIGMSDKMRPDFRVFGLAIAYQMLSLAIEQLSIKVIALQWIFGILLTFC
jgi:hypothetical protein